MNRWVKRVAAYETAHGVPFEIVGVINGRLGGMASLNNAITRANIVAGVRGLIVNQHLQGLCCIGAQARSAVKVAG